MPVPQFEPTTSAPAAARPATARSTLTPMTVKKPRGVRSNVIVAITGSCGATAFAALTARVASTRSLIVSMQTRSAPAAARTRDLLGERGLDRVGRRVAERLEELPRRPDRGRDERATADRAPHRLDRLAVDALLLGLEAVELQAEGGPAERVGRDEVGAGVDVEARDLLDHLRPLEREPLRRLARRAGRAP